MEAATRALAVLLSTMMPVLSGCSSLSGVLEPVHEQYADATKVAVLVSTTRAPSADRSILFSGERGQTSQAAISVSIPPDEARDVGQVQWPRQIPPNPAAEFAVLDVQQLDGKAQTAAWLRTHATKSRRALVFVHGFNTTFERSLIWFAQIAHDAGADATPVLFSWPSRGSLFEYSYDRESAAFSRDALERLLRELAASPAIDEITILAHSMGAWVTTETLRQMSIRDGRISGKIQTVILASPDIDLDVFRSQLQTFGKARPQFFVFISRRDRALRLSRRIAGNIERLGAVDPDADPWLVSEGIAVVDLTDTATGSWTRHAKFAENPDAIRFLGAQMINGSGDEPGGFGERLQSLSVGVTQGIGGAAGMVLTAPIAIVNPKARPAFANQFDQVQQAVDDMYLPAPAR